MSLHPVLLCVASATLLAACSKPNDAPVRTATPASAAHAATATGIAWKHATNDADVDAAFALARADKKPVFVYWGAQWCPPCNQLKATLFNRQDFIQRSRAFVPVSIDGDSPGAQKLGARFKVRGYPTMVLFNAEGAELTRLPGEVDAAQYTQLLTLGLNAQRPVKTVLADARAGGAGLSANEWTLLAFYSWETDEQQALAGANVPALLRQLAAACPAGQTETATRLMLKALIAGVDEKTQAQPDPQARERALALLASPAASRAQMDVLTNNAADITRALSAPKSPQRAALVQAFNTALKTLEADATLSRADRLTALMARVELAALDAAKDARPRLPDALLAEVRAHVARVDREISDGYERQAVITGAAQLLEQAGLLDESRSLLQANLANSHSPYYLMSALASNAKKRGDPAEALRWSEDAFKQSEGPATRLQWGASYVATLADLAPQDEARIERAVQQLFSEAGAQPDAFFERSARSLQRVGAKLLAWNKDHRHDAVVQRLQTQLAGVCSKLAAGEMQRAACDAVWAPAQPLRQAPAE
jgi:thioredoxin-like negative regulator of GroEL